MKKQYSLFIWVFLILLLNMNLVFAQQRTNQIYLYAIQQDENMSIYAVNPLSGISNELFHVVLGSGEYLEESTLSSDRQWLAYAVSHHGGASDIYVLNMQTQQSTMLLSDVRPIENYGLYPPPMLEWSPDGQRLLIRIEDYFNEFYVYDPLSTEIINQLQSNIIWIEEVQWASDSQRLLAIQIPCTSPSDCLIAPTILDANNFDALVQYDSGSFSNNGFCLVHWSPDARYIAYQTDCIRTGPPEDTQEIYIYDTQTDQLIAVTNFTEGTGASLQALYSAHYSLFWRSTDTLLIGVQYFNASGTDAQTLEYEVSTNTLTTLSNHDAVDWGISNTGRFLAYRAFPYDRSSYSLQIASLSELGLNVIYEQTETACNFDWSEDDRWLAYTVTEAIPYAFVCSLDVESIQFLDMLMQTTYSITLPPDEYMIPLGWNN